MAAADDEPMSTLTWEANSDGFGGPVNVVLNGHKLEAVQRIEVMNGDGQFAMATIVLGGVAVEVTKRVRKPQAPVE